MVEPEPFENPETHVALLDLVVQEKDAPEGVEDSEIESGAPEHIVIGSTGVTTGFSCTFSLNGSEVVTPQALATLAVMVYGLEAEEL